MKKKRKLGRKLLSFLLTLAMIVELMPGMGLTALAQEYSGSIYDDLQPGDILKPGADCSEKMTVILQANGWGDDWQVSTEDKQFDAEYGVRIDGYDGYIYDNDDNPCYPYANGEIVRAWEVVSVADGDNWDDPKTITLTGYAPPARTPVTEIYNNTTLTQDIEGYVTITGNVTLDLAGYTITGGGYHSTVIINDNSTLTLTDSSSGKTGTITGGGGEEGGGVLVKGHATFNMQGGKIKNNKATNGGGVAVEEGATFSMTGGTITGNNADQYGGGVYFDGTTFSMTGGIISNNKATAGDGGGVMINSGSFTMSGDSIIQSNSVESGNGGGVHVYRGSFSLQNGTISNNSCFLDGGGVSLSPDVTFNMTGGAIKENTADAGGGVRNFGSNFNMSNGLIDANRANKEGGGVYQYSAIQAVFTMTGGSITNNISGSNGYAGVCITGKGSFNLSGGAVIDGNKHDGTEEDICLYPGNMIKVTGTLTAENTMSVRLTNNQGKDSLTGTIAQGSGYTLTEADGTKFVASTSNRKAVYDSENQKEQLVAAYSVTYNGNGNTDGVVPVDSDSPYLNGSTVTVLGNTGSLAKTNYVFDGWNTAANGSGTPYEPDATFDITGDITLYAQWKPTHTHSWSYAIGTGEKANTITATCDGDGDCEYKTNGITLTIVAPTLTTYGGTGDAAATLDGLDAFNTATSKTIAATDIKYIGRDGTTYEEKTDPPAEAGKYTAKITVEEKTAFVNYEIAKVNPTAPTGLNATYGQTLADVTLPDGWTWADSTQSVGNVVDPAATFKANFAGDDNHNAASNVDVTVTVGKADQTAPTGLTATYGQTLADVTLPDGWTWADSTQSVGNVVDPAATFKANFAGNDNYNAASNVDVTVTVSKADPAAPTGLTATYGQTLADVTLPDGWTWADSTQSVGNVVDPAATFKANFAGDDNYKAASNVDVTVTVSKADATTAMQAASVSIAGTSGKTATVSYTLPDGASYGAVTNSNTEFFTVDTTSGIALTAAKNWTASDWATDTSKTFTVLVSGATNYNDYTLTVTVTPTYKATQTITAADVTATYGDTNAKIEATITSGGGTLSYTVKSGDAVTVNENTGALTIVKAGSAVITVTAAENDTYAAATKDVNVTVNTKAMTVSAENVNVYVDGQPHGITVNVTEPATGYTVKYGTEAGTYDQTTSPTQTEVGEKTVYYQVTADNYTTYTGSAKVTVSAKQTQMITAENVTAAYGDTGKSIEASTSGDGTLSYAVKSGDAVTVNETTGALTIVKAGSAVITVTASETDTYAQATKEVTVTINKANAVAATVTANTLTYTGSAQELVTVTGTPTCGTMYYALGTATEATEQYTTSIPTETNAGTYYVWYKVTGDENHNDTEPAYVTSIILAEITQTVTFKVVNGSWDDGTTADKTVTLSRLENEDKALVLKDSDIPAVGSKPAADFKAGSWDVTPDSKKAVTKDTTYTYTYAKKEETQKYSKEWVDGKWYNKDGTQTYKPLGSWKKDGSNWKYVDASGWYPKNQWQKIDFKWYFFDQKGHMLKDAYQKDASGKIWYIGKNGAWDEKSAVIGWKKDSKGWWFGLFGNDYLKNTWKMINGNWYYFKSDGYMAMNEFVQGWWLNKAGAWKDPVHYSWFKTGGKWWYGTKDGWYAKSKSYTIDGKKYTFDKKGYTK